MLQKEASIDSPRLQERIRDWLAIAWTVTMKYCYRECNGVANRLSKMALLDQVEAHVFVRHRMKS